VWRPGPGVDGSGSVQWGDRVEVTGQLVIEAVVGPIEDDLSAVRVWIKALSIELIPQTPVL
jgi:hypothetical protein